MSTKFQESMLDDLVKLVLENDVVQLSILPELGGKIVSLIWKPAGREHLWRHPGRPFRRPEYAGDFESYDISGWDECFPTIAEVVYPDPPWKGITVPDHGEVWALPWQWKFDAGVLRMWVHSVRFGYRFERAITLRDAGQVDISYRVVNPTPFPLKSLWSMHPFFNVTPSSRVLLPAGVSVRVDYSLGWRIGSYLSNHDWPRTIDNDGEIVDLGLMGPEQPFFEKLFTTRLPAGWTALYDEADGGFLAFTFDPDAVPYVGICHMRGGWPANDVHSYSTILEPCSGWPDRLDIAASRGDYLEIPAEGERTWDLTLPLGQGKPELEHAIGCPVDSDA